MMHQVQRYSFLLLSVFLLTACVTTKVADEPVGSTIESIQTTTRSGTVPPKYKRSSVTTLNAADLSVKKVVKDYEGNIVFNKSITITQAQFDGIVEEIKTMDISKLKSRKLPRAPVGGGSDTVSIKTNKASYSFMNGGADVYPAEVARVFAGISKLFSN